MEESENSMESFTMVFNKDLKEFTCQRCNRPKKSKRYVNWVDKNGNKKRICNGCYRYLKSHPPKDCNTDNIDGNSNGINKDLIISSNASGYLLEKAEIVTNVSKTSNMNRQSYEEDLNSVKQKGNNIQNISNPSLKIQLEAVKQNGYAIRYIENPVEQVQLKAVCNQGLAIRYIMNPSEEVKLEAVKQNGYAIEFISNPSFDLQLHAVKTTGSSIKFINDPNLLLQLEAVKNNGLSIQFIKNPSFEVQYEAVNQRGIAIKYIKDPVLEIQKEAVKQNLLAIQHIEQPFEEVQLEVIKRNASYLKYIKNPTEKVMLEAIKKDAHITENLGNSSLYEQLETAHQSKEAYDKISNSLDELEEKHIDKSLNDIKGSQINIRPIIKQNDNDTKRSRINIEELRNRYFNLQDEKIEYSIDKFFIINNDEPLDEHINFLCQEIDVTNIYIASGFVYKSGLKRIEVSLEKAFKNNGEIHLVIGTLQNYNKVIDCINDRIAGMDKNTASYINELLINSRIKVRTLEKSFFHGKFYFLEGKEKCVVIIGSSNVSTSGFFTNTELNLLYIFNKKFGTKDKFKIWFETLWNECTEINQVNINYFNEIEMQYDTNVHTATIQKMDISDVKRRINELTDEEVKKRLNLWLNKNPDNIYTDLRIPSLEGYVLFEYQDYNLLVLESFDSGNAYYHFVRSDVQILIETIRTLSKTEIFNVSEMSKRGYHIKNQDKLEISINSLFIRKYNLKKL